MHHSVHQKLSLLLARLWQENSRPLLMLDTTHALTALLPKFRGNNPRQAFFTGSYSSVFGDVVEPDWRRSRTVPLVQGHLNHCYHLAVQTVQLNVDLAINISNSLILHNFNHAKFYNWIKCRHCTVKHRYREQAYNEFMLLVKSVSFHLSKLITDRK